jgi:hypothetical protein
MQYLRKHRSCSRGGDKEAINERRLGTKKDTADYIAFSGVVWEVSIGRGRQLYYNACPNTACKNRKVEENGGIIACRAGVGTQGAVPVYFQGV